MRAKTVLTLLFVSFALCAQAQEWRQKTLFTVGDEEVTAGEFANYYKNKGGSSDIDDFLARYILYKQKVADAKSEKIDQSASFINEIKSYRDALAQDYLTDNSIKEQLLKDAYERYMTEVHAWHILVLCPSDATPADTASAWKKAINIRERLRSGEPFEQVARGSSDDPSVKINGGDLGYFTAFQTIPSFENAAYTLKIGQLSMPIRTSNGYHIIKVVDRRPSKGTIQVAHIMKAVDKDATESEEKEAEKKINDIYNRLRSGANFEELARKESDHISTAANGGVMDWFGAGEITSSFSEAAFSLERVGDISHPIRTTNGWHIIKLLAKKNPPSFEESKKYLESQLKQSNITSKAKESLITKLKDEYKYKVNSSSRQWFVDHTDSLIIRGIDDYRKFAIPEGTLYTFADKKISNAEFANFVRNRGPIVKTTNPSTYVNAMIKANSSDEIMEYENSILETKYPEFGEYINEFKEDVLVFDISEIRLWNKINKDTTQLYNYYEQKKNEYMSPRSLMAKIYTYKKKGGEKTFWKVYKKMSTR